MKPGRVALLGAFAIVYVVWGSTYLGLRIGVRDMPPGLFAGVRFVLAGVIMMGVARLMGQAVPLDAKSWRHATIIGFALVVIANGVVTWAEQWVPSNQAALLVSTGAFWMAWLGTFGPKGEPLTARIVVGLVIGFAGAALVLWPQGGVNLEHLGAQLAILVAPLAWSLGTVYGRNVDIRVPTVMLTGMQMLVAGAVLVAIGLAAGELPQWRWTLPGVSVLAYLTLIGSCLAFGTYLWLIRYATPGGLATIAYGNLAVATVLGWWLLDERLSGLQTAGLFVIVAGMLIVNRPARA